MAPRFGYSSCRKRKGSNLRVRGAAKSVEEPLRIADEGPLEKSLLESIGNLRAPSYFGSFDDELRGKDER